MVLSVIILIFTVVSFTSCGREADTVIDDVDQELKEAPELAKMVEEGTLPPLEERLPENPLVVNPLESVGIYGGTWRNVIVGGNLFHLVRYQAYDRLVRWSPDWDEVIPNIAEKFEVSPDSKEFTFYLRKGMRWSDGEPFTADDFEFFFNDVISNEKLNPVFPDIFVSGGERAIFTKIDEYTFKYTFTEPSGLFLLRIAEPGMSYLPKHYLKQFHAEYNSDADELASGNGYANWVEMFLAKGGSYQPNDYLLNADFPVVYPWKFTVVPDGSSSVAIAERNPYFWKVDPDGKQLPYIDKIEYAMLSDNEVALLKALNGELDFHDQHIATPANKSVLYDNQDKGNYHLTTTSMTAPNAMSIMFNMTHPDPLKREIFGDKNFRIGMSYAIDRQEIIDIVFFGQGTPQQVAPRPESDLYNEKMATQYTEFDMDKANEYLDKVMPNKDNDGYRLMSNGKRFVLQFEIDAARDVFIDGMELMMGYWKNVGVDVQMKTMDRSLWDERVRNGGLADATIHRFGGGTGSLVLTDPRYYFPMSNNGMYAPSWAKYYVDHDRIDSGAEVPPENVRKQMDLYGELLVTGSEKEQKEIMIKILDIASDIFYHVGICTEPDSYAVVNNDLVNVPERMPWNYLYPHPAPTNPCTWYYK